jgi:hypothetical protein
MNTWEEIHVFAGPREFGRWFKFTESGVTGRLVPPDPPFPCLWEAVLR